MLLETRSNIGVRPANVANVEGASIGPPQSVHAWRIAGDCGENTGCGERIRAVKAAGGHDCTQELSGTVVPAVLQFGLAEE